MEEEMEVFGIPLAREREKIHHVEAVAPMMKSFLWGKNWGIKWREKRVGDLKKEQVPLKAENIYYIQAGGKFKVYVENL